MAPALCTEADRGSGGCGVAAKKGTGITPVEQSLIAEEYQHRLSAAWVNAVVPGGLQIISVYLPDTEGLSPYNLALLQEAAALVRNLKGRV